MPEAEDALSVVPANEATCDDLQTIFGQRGQGSRCRCQRYKLSPRESFASFPVEERADRLRRQTDCGYPESDGDGIGLADSALFDQGGLIGRAAQSLFVAPR